MGVCAQCGVCAISGPPVPVKKLSLNHVNQNFNDEIQTAFLFAKIRNENYTIIHFAETGTTLSERAIGRYRKATTIIKELDRLWAYRHARLTEYQL